jgi:hypothetical protein
MFYISVNNKALYLVWNSQRGNYEVFSYLIDDTTMQFGERQVTML